MPTAVDGTTRLVGRYDVNLRSLLGTLRGSSGELRLGHCAHNPDANRAAQPELQK